MTFVHESNDVASSGSHLWPCGGTLSEGVVWNWMMVEMLPFEGVGNALVLRVMGASLVELPVSTSYVVIGAVVGIVLVAVLMVELRCLCVGC